jgi:hypothetical protein
MTNFNENKMKLRKVISDSIAKVESEFSMQFDNLKASVIYRNTDALADSAYYLILGGKINTKEPEESIKLLKVMQTLFMMIQIILTLALWD